MEVSLDDVRASLAASSSAGVYELLGAISSGGFGLVVKAKHVPTGEVVAIKFIDCRNLSGVKLLVREIVSHQKLLHAHIVQFKCCFAAPPFCCIALEYVPDGDLVQYINQQPKGLREDEARWLFQQLIMALDYCHRMGVMNRDIKPDNVLLVRVPGRPAVIKICDFGYAKTVDDSAPKTRAGTLHYVAPEVLGAYHERPYNAFAADVWSCGVLLYTMLFASLPFAREEDRRLSAGQQLRIVLPRMLAADFTFPPDVPISEECKHLIQSILVDVSRRLDLEGIKRHPWFLKNLLPGTFEYNEQSLRLQPPPGQQTPENIEAIVNQVLNSNAAQEVHSDPDSDVDSDMG